MSEVKEDENNNNELSKIEKNLKEVDPKIFEGLPKQKKQQIIKSFAYTMHKTHVGPLPDPETLLEYDKIIPNGADRIMKMVETQLQHRIHLESRVVGGQLSQSNLGQILAFLTGLAALVASTYCIISGHEISGIALGLGGLTSLVTAFIKGKDYQNKNLGEKRPEKR